MKTKLLMLLLVFALAACNAHRVDNYCKIELDLANDAVEVATASLALAKESSQQYDNIFSKYCETLEGRSDDECSVVLR